MHDQTIANLLSKYHARRFEDVKPFSEYLKIVEARDTVLQRFQRDFSSPADLSAETFREFLAFENNQHWTNLHRGEKKIIADMPRLRAALQHLFDEQIPIASRFDALTDGSEIQVKSLGKGTFTAALHIRFPDKYGVWNGKSEAALKSLDLWPARERGTSDGTQYAAMNQIFLKFAGLVGVDLWCLDGLWHVVNGVGAQQFDNDILQTEHEEKEFREGRKVLSLGYRAERSAAAREDCVKAKGFTCEVCGFNFLRFYGEIGLHFIHVHHQDDLANGERDTKLEHLVPVCPNCHAMLHRNVEKSRPIAELKEIIRRTQQG